MRQNEKNRHKIARVNWPNEVFIKGRLWLEIYEGYLSTGKSLEHFLAYMPK